MDRWLIYPVSVEVDSEQLDIDPTIQAERKEIVRDMADGTQCLYGVEQDYIVYLLEHRDIKNTVNATIKHGGQCIDSGQFKVKNEQHNIIRLSKIQPIN
jgi:hypothetical protein